MSANGLDFYCICPNLLETYISFAFVIQRNLRNSVTFVIISISRNLVSKCVFLSRERTNVSTRAYNVSGIYM